MKQNNLYIPDAAESNAGDNYHAIWAVRKSLELLNFKPDGLKALAIENLHPIDEQNLDRRSLLGIDLTEYYGGEDFATAHRVVVSQVKYSTRHAAKPWSAADLCRGKKTGPSGSVIERLGYFFNDFSAKHPQNITKLSLKLVSNRPIATEVTSFLGKVKVQPAAITTSGLKKKLTTAELKIWERLRNAAGVQDKWLIRFLNALDFSDCHAGSPLVQKVRSYEAISKLGTMESRDQFAKLKELINERMQPASRGNHVLYKDDILFLFGFNDLTDLFPVNNRIISPANLVPRLQLPVIKDLIIDPQISMLCIHGAGGIGKSTLVTSLPTLLPEGSKSILFDCYGNGAYNDSEDKRHKPEHALLQLANEMALACNTPFLLLRGNYTDHYVRELKKRMIDAVAGIRAVNPSAVLALFIDAADNSITAARQFHSENFITELAGMSLPAGCKIIFTSRTQRLDLLGLPDKVRLVEIQPFNRSETAAYLSISAKNLTDDLIDNFHRLTYGNPRVMSNVMELPGQNLKKKIGSLKPDGKTLEQLFQLRIHEAEKKAPDPAIVTQFLTGLVALPAPAPESLLISLCKLSPGQLTDLRTDLWHGLIFENGNFSFRDEDLETFVRNKYPVDIAYYSEIAQLLLNEANDNDYASIHLAMFLTHAGLNSTLIDIVINRKLLNVPVDPIKNKEVFIDRVSLAMKGTKSYGLDFFKLQFVAAEAAKSNDIIENILLNHAELAAAYGDLQTNQKIYFQSGNPGWFGPVHFRNAAIFSRDKETRETAIAHLQKAESWLRYRETLSSEEKQNFNFNSLDIAYGAEAVLRIYGPRQCANYVNNWNPKSFSYQVLQDLLGILIPIESNNQLNIWMRQFNLRLRPDLRILVVSLFFVHGLKVNFEWVDILEKPVFGRLRNKPPLVFQETVLSFIEFAIGKKSSLEEVRPFLKLITETYSHHLPGFYHSSIDDSALIDMDLLFRVKAIAKYTDGGSWQLSDFYPEAMRAAFAGKDAKEQNKYTEYKSKLDRGYRHLLKIYDCRAGFLLGRITEKATTSELKSVVKGINDDWELQYQNQYQYSRIRHFLAMKLLDIVFHCKEENALIAIVDGFKHRRGDNIHLSLAIASAISKHDAFHAFTLKLLNEVEAVVIDDMMSGSEIMDFYQQATIISSRIAKSEGKYYFDKMVQAADEIDEEAYDQIRAIDTITKGRSFNDPEVAFNFARYVEYCSARLGNNEYFPWTEANDALAAIDIRTLFPLACRWDHRNVRKLKEHFTQLLYLNLKTGLIDHRAAAGLMPMVSYYGQRVIEIVSIILAGFDTEGSAQQKSTFLRAFIRDLKIRTDTKSDVKIVDEYLSLIDNGKYLDPSLIADLKNFSAELKKLTSYKIESENASRHQRKIALGKAITRQLKGVKIDEDLDLNKLLIDLRGGNEHGYVPISDIFAHLRKKAKLNEAKHLLDAIARLTEPAISYHGFETILSETISEWKHLSVLKAWQPSAFQQVLRHWLPMLTSYHSLEYTSVRKLRDLFDSTDQVVAAFVIESLPSDIHGLSAGIIYNLFQLTSTGLTPADKLELCKWIIARWTEPIKADFGDGVYSTDLVPPADGRTLVGGLLHYNLGHPVRALRWRAAHAIRRLADQEQVWLIDYLMAATTRPQIGCFQDRELTFFSMSARLYLFIALDRVCKENHNVLAGKSGDFLKVLADENLPHAQIKYFVRSICLHMQSIDPTIYTPAEINVIDQILSPVSIRKKTQEYHAYRKHQPVDDEIRFAFDSLDTIDEWYRPLAGIFGVEVHEFLVIVDRLIAESWGFTGNVRELDHVRKQGYERTSTRHGDEPVVEDLRTYYEYHGMFCAAYDLLKSRGVVENGYYESWDEWLRGWATCWDNYWLADFRDPIPLEPRFWQRVEVGRDWEFSILPDDFNSRLGLGSERDQITLQEDSTIYYGKDNEKLLITTGLVDPATGPALLTAMQTVTAYQSYIPFPKGEDDEDFEEGNEKFQAERLSDWLKHVTTGIDDRDPNFHDYSRDRVRPAKLLIDSLGLTVTDDFRESFDGNHHSVTRYQVWNNTTREHSYGDFSSLGYRWTIKKTALLTLLQNTGKCLIVNCQMGRDLDRREHHEYYPDYCLIYLIYPDGTVNTLNRSYQIR